MRALRVPSGSTVRLDSVNEDLDVEGNARIICSGISSALVVNGKVTCEGSVVFEGSLRCDEFKGTDCRVTITSLNCRDLSVEDGTLEILKDLDCASIDVDKRLRVGGKTVSEDIEVGGVLELNSVQARSIDVGGSFRALGDADVDSIDVGGVVDIGGKINARSVDVGGKVKLAGGKVSEKIDVGGVFESTEPLSFGNIDVGGVVSLIGPSNGGDIEVGGRMSVRGDLSLRDLEVGGSAEVSGTLRALNVEIGGRLSVRASLLLSEALDVGGTVNVEEDSVAKSVDVRGSFRSRSLKVENADLSGHVKTERGIFATGRLIVERRCRVEGWLRSLDSIEIESRAEVGSVYAPRILVEKKATAENLYGDEIEMKEGAEARGEVLYTRILRLESPLGMERIRITRPPLKVDSIPDKTKQPWSGSL